MDVSLINAYSNTYTSTYKKKVAPGTEKTEVDKSVSTSKSTVTTSVQSNNRTDELSGTYSKASSVNANTDKTTFPPTDVLYKFRKYLDALNEHYSKVNEENMKFADPEKHIDDKYFNKKSPYYVKGLTNLEREICWQAEYDVYHGEPPALNSYDPVIQEKFGGCNIFIMDMEGNQDARNALNEAVDKAFEENGIVIPEEADLQLTVDPYDYQIHASGVDDNLAASIEQALNKGKNGYYLYQHILQCNPRNYNVEEPGQYISGDTGKMAVYHLVDQLTGYDIRKLEYKDGKFFTPDGEDLWNVLEDKYDEMLANGEAGPFNLGNYADDYKYIAQTGWTTENDCNLSVDYREGYLYDIGTNYGYGPGQTKWQDNVRNWYKGIHDEYRKERAETLIIDENTPTKLETMIAETEQYNAQFEEKAKYSTKGWTESLLQKLLKRMVKDGLARPKSNMLMKLKEEHRDTIPFDCKA